MKYKLSKYHILSDVLTTERRNSKVIIYPIRTGKPLIITKGVYHLLKEGACNYLPDSLFFTLVRHEILVPSIENELETILKRINSASVLGIILELNEFLDDTYVCGIIEAKLASKKYTSINLIWNIKEKEELKLIKEKCKIIKEYISFTKDVYNTLILEDYLFIESDSSYFKITNLKEIFISKTHNNIEEILEKFRLFFNEKKLPKLTCLLDEYSIENPNITSDLEEQIAFKVTRNFIKKLHEFMDVVKEQKKMNFFKNIEFIPKFHPIKSSANLAILKELNLFQETITIKKTFFNKLELCENCVVCSYLPICGGEWSLNNPDSLSCPTYKDDLKDRLNALYLLKQKT